MDIELLTSFGMTNVEAKIYLEILKSKQSQIGPIIERTSLHRGTVYNSINNLIGKGFVCFVNKSGVRYYGACSNKTFDNLIENKKIELDENKKKIDKLFNELSVRESSEHHDVNVFMGVEAFKNAFLEIFDYCKKNKCEYLFQGRGGEMQDATGEAFYRYTQKLKKKMKINCRVILDTENRKHSYHKYVHGNIRHLPSKLVSPVNFWIYGDTVLIVLFRAEPLSTIRIKSINLANSFRNYFEYLWNIAGK